MAIDPTVARAVNYELTDLNENVKNLNQTMAGVFGVFAPVLKKQNELDAELAKLEEDLAKTIKNNTNKSHINSLERRKLYLQELKYRRYSIDARGKAVKSQERLNAEQREKLYWLDKQIAKDNELARALDKPIEVYRQMSSSINSLGGIFEKFSSNLQDGSKKSAFAAGSLQLLFATSKGLFGAFTTMTDALYQGERGASVAAKGYKAFADAASSAVIGIGAAMVMLPFGKVAKVAGLALGALGIAAKGATKIVEITAEVNDKLYNSYNKLSQSGITTSEGMTGLFNTLQKIGLTTAEIEKFNTLLGEGSKDLAIFGGGVANGVKFYTKVANQIATPTSKIGKELELLGITTDNQREGIMKFMAEETRLGMLKDKNEIYAQKGAVAYLEKLDGITRLTGITRKEQEEARAAVMANEELRAAIFEAEQDKTEEGQKRLAKLKRAFEAAAILQARGDVRGATGIAQYAAAGGIAGEASAVAFQTFGGKGGLIDVINKGGTETEMAVAIGSGYKRQLDRMAPTIAIAGFQAGSDYITANVGVAVDAQKQMQEFVKAATDLGMTPSQYLKYLQDEAKTGPDETLEKNVQARRIQQEAAQTIDKAAVKFGLGGVALKAASKMMQESVELFEKAMKIKIDRERKPAPDIGLQGEWEAYNAALLGTSTDITEEQVKVLKTIPKVVVSTSEETARMYKTRAGVGREETKPSRPPMPPGTAPTPSTPTPTPSTPTPAEPTKPGVPSKTISVDDILSFGGKSGSKSNFEDLDSSFKNRVIAAAQEYNKQTGNKIKINSAKRDPADQQRLWDESVSAGRPGISPTGMPIGKPGTSSHERGVAVDIQNYQDALAIAAFNNQGLFQTVANDPVHFTLKKANFGGLFSGPDSGYFVEMHGKEFIGNEKHIEQIKKLISIAEQNNILNNTKNINENSEMDNTTSEMLIKLSEILETKVDELTEKIRTGNSTDEDLLNYSRA